MDRDPRYEVLPHTADLGVRVRGRDAAELFANAAFALSDNLVDLASVEPAVERTVAVEADDFEDLLVRWLGEILFVFEQEAFVGREFDVAIETGAPPAAGAPEAPADAPAGGFAGAGARRLHAVARGERVDPARHTVYSEIKAVTYHALVVAQDEAGWRAEVVFDL